MKTINIQILLFFSLFALFSTNPIFSQTGWFPCNTGTTKNLSSVYFVNQNTGWVAGYLGSGDYYGIILKTTNGGTNWIIKVDEYNFQPETIFFTDINTGWVTGDRFLGLNKSAIKKTTNAGLNWVDVAIGDSTLHTFSVYFINLNTGWISARDNNNFVFLYKTTNGGFNWSAIQTGFTSSTYGPKIQFLNENTGYLAALQLLKTTNSGNNWIISDIGSNVIASQPYFTDINTGWVTGYSQNPAAYYIKKTANGGNNWISQWSYPIAAGHAIFSLYFINSITGWGVGSEYVNSSYIIRTTDGGLTWGSQTSQTYTSALNSVFFTDANYGWAIGTNGRVLRTTNGGDPVGIETINNNITNYYSLSQNYPNPFNPSTNIEFQIPYEGFVKLTIYNMLGEEVETIVNKQMQPGTFKVNYDGSNLSSGVYYYTLQTEKFKETKKLVLIK